MSTTQEHIKAARGLLRGFQGLEAAAAALEAVGTAEDRVYELNKAIQEQELAKHTAEVEAQNSRTLLGMLEADIKTAKDEAIAIRGRLRSDAEAEAVGIVEAAKTEAAGLVSDAKEKVAAHKHKAAELAQKLNELDQSISHRTTELQGLNDAIAAIRAKF